MAQRKQPAVKCRPVSESMVVYRLVRRKSMDRAILEEELRTDAEDGEREPDRREHKFPVLYHSRSVFSPEEKALRKWRKGQAAAEQASEELRYPFLAELRIVPAEGLCVEQRGNDGHLLLWGGKTELAAKVVRVFDPTTANGEV